MEARTARSGTSTPSKWRGYNLKKGESMTILIVSLVLAVITAVLIRSQIKKSEVVKDIIALVLGLIFAQIYYMTLVILLKFFGF